MPAPVTIAQDISSQLVATTTCDVSVRVTVQGELVAPDNLEGTQKRKSPPNALPVLEEDRQSSTASASGASGKSSSTSGEEHAVQEGTRKRKSPPDVLRKEPPKNKVPVKDELLKACAQSATADADGNVDPQLLARAIGAGYSKYFVLLKVEEHLESIKDTKYTVGMQFAALANAYPNSFAEV